MTEDTREDTQVARLGAHVSVAGGVSKAFGRAAALGCDALQIFVKNASRWQAPPLEHTEVARFKEARAAQGCPPVVAHASYLINLAAANPATLERSWAALADELSRCRMLGIDALVLHPGAHVGQGEAAGLDLIATSLDGVLGMQPEGVKVLLENTAGQGTVLGSRFEHLAQIIATVDAPARLGICLDTCHAFAAGYDLVNCYDAVLEDFGARLGWARLGCVHLNDSQHALGSRRDRHANLGAGSIGVEAFVRLASDARVAAPLVLETPLGADGLGHGRDLAALRARL